MSYPPNTVFLVFREWNDSDVYIRGDARLFINIGQAKKFIREDIKENYPTGITTTIRIVGGREFIEDWVVDRPEVERPVIYEITLADKDDYSDSFYARSQYYERYFNR